jgi:hypothetical protein
MWYCKVAVYVSVMLQPGWLLTTVAVQATLPFGPQAIVTLLTLRLQTVQAPGGGVADTCPAKVSPLPKRSKNATTATESVTPYPQMLRLPGYNFGLILVPSFRTADAAHAEQRVRRDGNLVYLADSWVGREPNATIGATTKGSISTLSGSPTKK